MAVFGRKQLTYEQRRNLFRTSPREIRMYSCDLTDNYAPLLDSFTMEDYQLYERMLHAYKRVESMLKYCSNRNIQGPILELATIRSQDLRLHQKLVQVLRHKWTDIWEVKQTSVNEDANKFWFRMASSIQRRSKSENIELHPAWAGTDGRLLLIEFLKELYNSQEHNCAISKTPLSLAIGIGNKNYNKCSPDRIDSNIGYVPGNIWLVTWWANSMKLDTPLDVFWQRIKILSAAMDDK